MFRIVVCWELNLAGFPSELSKLCVLAVQTETHSTMLLQLYFSVGVVGLQAGRLVSYLTQCFVCMRKERTLGKANLFV